VIGNGAYAHVPHLPNPSHDAEDVAAALKRTGFQTIVGIDLDQAGMQDAAIRFARAARTADIAMFYYSGHAMQYAGVNYLMPIDALLQDEADLRRMVRVDDILSDLQQAKNLRILVLDSCRDNPLADDLKRSIGITRSANIGRGLARIDNPEGMIVAYATQAGRTADDGDGHNSPYTAAFLKNIEAKDEIGTIFRRVSSDVYTATRQAQLPELSLSLIGEFYLNGKMQITVTLPPAMPTDPCANASEHWKSAETIGTLEAYQDHVARFPNCTFAGLAKARIEALKNKTAAVAPPEPLARPQTNDAVNGFSAWLSNASYQKLFDDMASKHWYPSIVEGRSSDGARQFRAKFVPRGKLSSFWSHHGITVDMFNRRDAALRRQGYVLVAKQSFHDDWGEAVQATWILK
jgi:caspase domain-containing protein/polyglycine hydrolase-like protein